MVDCLRVAAKAIVKLFFIIVLEEKFYRVPLNVTTFIVLLSLPEFKLKGFVYVKFD